jgi:hydroxymethylpyrimidine pyrophosphatase-like HAD family hydrolase
MASSYSSKTVWIFDVDGVLTNPQRKTITQEGLIEKIAEKLDKGDVIALNTGRSLSWVEERVLRPFMKLIKEKSKLVNLFVVGEKGGTWAFFENGAMIVKIDKSFDLPESLKQEIRQLIKNDFSDSMFYEASKLTIISPEMIDGYEIADYAREQSVLVKRLKRILNKPKYRKLKLKIDPSIIAVDVQIPRAGKHSGVRRIENWLKGKSITPSKVIMIGDSQADTEMAEELQNEYPVEFVFVGDPKKVKTDKLKCEPIFTQKLFEAGTLEFLQKR